MGSLYTPTHICTTNQLSKVVVEVIRQIFVTRLHQMGEMKGREGEGGLQFMPAPLDRTSINGRPRAAVFKPTPHYH